MYKFLSWVAGPAAAALLAGLITAMTMGAIELEEYKRKCMMQGGIPVKGYCVKPGYFIEVK